MMQHIATFRELEDALEMFPTIEITKRQRIRESFRRYDWTVSTGEPAIPSNEWSTPNNRGRAETYGRRKPFLRWLRDRVTTPETRTRMKHG